MNQAWKSHIMPVESGESRGVSSASARAGASEKDNRAGWGTPSERTWIMHRPLSRRQFIVKGGKVALGAGIAGSLLAGCGGGSSGGGQVTYWSNLETPDQHDY